ncbi:MAG: phenylalanine--tRNA ligase subunit beta [Planctomycetota bacterium]
MKISYNWLQDYCPVQLPAHRLAERLSHSGLCVETYEPAGKDYMLDVEVTSNRPDCLSHLGIAREVAAFSGSRVKYPTPDIKADPELEFDKVAGVQVECPELCPHYTARLIRDVEVGPSPDWMQKRLEVCGIRPVNNVVDITNYVLLESGQPLHAFDLDKVADNTIVVRRAQEGEEITTIDGETQTLSPDMCVIADAGNPVAVAGVMGGLDSEIGNATTDLLLESARFDPPSVRRTSRRLGLSSESSYRFERGVDPENVATASRRAAELILELCGGHLAEGWADIRSDQTTRPSVTMRFGRMQTLLGLSVDPEEVSGIFEGLGLDIREIDEERVSVRVPSWRADLRREVDLIEEVARVHGYDEISEQTRIPVRMSSLPDNLRHQRTVRQTLTGQGFDEIMTYSLVDDRTIHTCQPWTDDPPIELRNPVSSDKTHLRATNVGNILEAKRHNTAHGVPRVDLFEMGKIYLPQSGGTDQLPEEKSCLTLLTDREDGFFVLKGVLDNLLDVLNCCAVPEENSGSASVLHPEQSVLWEMEGSFLGFTGMVREEVAENLDLDTVPAIMELDFDLLESRAELRPTLQALPQFPAADRDVAVVVDESVQWKELKGCIDSNAPEHLESVQFFDIYRGDQVEEDKKSVAFSISLRSPERTLTRKEADAARDTIVEALNNELDAELRG